MIEKGDKIAVALSGGKDSAAALYLLNELFSHRPDIEMVAVTIDEGIKGYRPKTMKAARKISTQLGIEQQVFTFSEAYGVSLDEIVDNGGSHPCTYCGVLRKSLLNRAARDLGVTKLATGHNLDDESQSILMNYLRGDLGRLARLYPTSIQPGLVPRIKPLRDVPEKESALYALIKELPAAFDECPYASLSLRSDVRNMINEYELKHPGTRYSIVRGFERIYPFLDKSGREHLTKCRECGEPSAHEICEACSLLKDFRLGKEIGDFYLEF